MTTAPPLVGILVDILAPRRSGLGRKVFFDEKPGFPAADAFVLFCRVPGCLRSGRNNGKAERGWHLYADALSLQGNLYKYEYPHQYLRGENDFQSLPDRDR